MRISPRNIPGGSFLERKCQPAALTLTGIFCAFALPHAENSQKDFDRRR